MPTFTDPWLPAGTVPTLRAATPVAVYRVTGSGTLTYTALPNVVCVAIEEHEGPAPASALFRYRFAGDDEEGPQSAEQALSTAFSGDHVVEPGDRLAVLATKPNASTAWIFDGLAMNFEMDLDGDTEHVAIHAASVAKRCWDTPIGGASYRQSDDPETAADVATDVVPQFNPKGEPNASPGTTDSGSGDATYPVFMDPTRKGTDADDEPYPRLWTLPMAAAYLIYRDNPAGGYVDNPTRSFLDGLLVARKPITGTPFDPSDSGTYTASPIYVPDTPLAGHAWPNALHDLLKDYGFGMRFKLTTVGTDPVTSLVLWYKQAAAAKPLLLQTRGSTLNPALSNLGAAGLGRDLTEAVNSWRVRGAPDRYEVSLVLAPGFPSTSSDSSLSTLDTFDVSADGFEDADAHDKYRLWIFDETGEGHYANASLTKLTTIASLDDLFGEGNYVRRRRAPIGTLFSLDSLGKPLKWRVDISTDYANAYPLLWDGTGTWKHAPGFELLKDRLGVWLSVTHPNKWTVGKHDVIKVVEAISAVDSTNPAFFVRLTAVVEADKGLLVTAPRLASAPLAQTVLREVDARDRYRKCYVHGKSAHKSTTGNLTVRDDAAAAESEAIALRTANDAGVFEGSVTIPRFTAVYEVGDRISSIDGRGLSLRTDSGDTDYAPIYPVVVKRRWDLDGHQRTTLTLSDGGLNRRRYAAKHLGTRYHR